MARNRKNESVAARFAPALKALLLCAFFVASGVGYVWYKSQIGILGHQKKACEIRLVELQRQNQMRRDQLAALCSPVALDIRVKKLNLGLVPPSLTQIIRLSDAQPPFPSPPSEIVVADQRQARTEMVERGN